MTITKGVRLGNCGCNQIFLSFALVDAGPYLDVGWADFVSNNKGLISRKPLPDYVLFVRLKVGCHVVFSTDYNIFCVGFGHADKK